MLVEPLALAHAARRLQRRPRRRARPGRARGARRSRDDLVAPTIELLESFGLSVWVYRGADWLVRDPDGPHVDARGAHGPVRADRRRRASTASTRRREDRRRERRLRRGRGRARTPRTTSSASTSPPRARSRTTSTSRIRRRTRAHVVAFLRSGTRIPPDGDRDDRGHAQRRPHVRALGPLDRDGERASRGAARGPPRHLDERRRRLRERRRDGSSSEEGASAWPRTLPMQLGMVGLGRMGAGIVRRLMKDGHRCVGYDVYPDAVKALEADGAAGSSSLEEFAAKLEKPRAAWVMVPAGDITDKTITALAEVLEPGDTIIDGGNTHYVDDIRHAERAPREGHPPRRRRHERRRLGLRARLLPDDRRREGGRRPAQPDLRLDRAGRRRRRADAGTHGRAEPGRARLLPLRAERRRPLREDGAQRHRVRAHGRVRRRAQRPRERRHRQAAARRWTPRPRRSSTPSSTSTRSTPREVAEVWRRGSVVGSWLLDLTAQALQESPKLEEFAGRVSDSGEGRWTSIAAIEEGVPDAGSDDRALLALLVARTWTTSRTGCSPRCASSSAGTTRRRADDARGRSAPGRGGGRRRGAQTSPLRRPPRSPRADRFTFAVSGGRNAVGDVRRRSTGRCRGRRSRSSRSTSASRPTAILTAT